MEATSSWHFACPGVVALMSAFCSIPRTQTAGRKRSSTFQATLDVMTQQADGCHLLLSASSRHRQSAAALPSQPLMQHVVTPTDLIRIHWICTYTCMLLHLGNKLRALLTDMPSGIACFA